MLQVTPPVAPMSRFYFAVKNRDQSVLDPSGEDFESVEAARDFAELLARELMRNREGKTRSWRVQVSNAQHEPCFEVLFALVDDSIAHFRTDVREAMQKLARRAAALSDTMVEARHYVRQAKATVARAKRRPYLAAVDGRRT